MFVVWMLVLGGGIDGRGDFGLYCIEVLGNRRKVNLYVEMVWKFLSEDVLVFL